MTVLHHFSVEALLFEGELKAKIYAFASATDRPGTYLVTRVSFMQLKANAVYAFIHFKKTFQEKKYQHGFMQV
jgi:hypothetical protein